MSVPGAVDIAESVRARRVSATDVARAALERVARDDGSVNAFVSVDPHLALAAAWAIDRRIAAGEDPGPLAGAPFGVKDNEAVAGHPTRHGSLVHRDAPPETEDSLHVSRLRAAGAVPIGKVAAAEFGLDGVTHTLAHGTCRNPWNLERTPGGSSGGSAAAVAAGLVPLCTGSDALGSIRVPAAYTGLLGLKPSHGRIPRAHGFRDTACMGPLAMTAADVARYLDVASGPSDRDHMTLPAPTVRYEQAIETLDLRGVRAVYSPDLGFAPMDPETADLCARAFNELVRAAGLSAVEGRRDFINVYPEWNALAALELMGDFERLGMLPDHIDEISPGPRSLIEGAIHLSPAEQSEYRARIRTLEVQVAGFFQEVELLVTPTACCAAYAAEGPLPTVIAGQDARHTNAEPFTAIGSICWNPSISIPAGVTRDGLPVGLLLNGPRHRDDIVLRIARLWEQANPWPRVAPAYDRMTEFA
jgi:aspartyl-tRNA(Asn)/glutamyl-tRNA(Gln) amidotransferase subunit A